MKIKQPLMAIIIVVALFGGIGATMAAEIWTTTSDKTPVRYNEGEHAGEYNPEDIRGSYTFADVSDLFDINIQVLYSAFGIEQSVDAGTIRINELETLYSGMDVEIGNQSMQVFVALYKGLPIVLYDAYLTKTAVDLVIAANPNLSEEQMIYLQTHYIETENDDKTSSDNNETSIEEHSLVNGSTTFREALDFGLKAEQIEEIIQDVLPPTNQTIQAYCKERGLQFSLIKEQMNQLID